MMGASGSAPLRSVFTPAAAAVALLADLPVGADRTLLSRSRVFVVGPDASPDAVRAVLGYAGDPDFADRSIVFVGGAGDGLDIPPPAAARCNFIRTALPRSKILWVGDMLAADRDDPVPVMPPPGWDIAGQFRIRTLDDVERCARLLSGIMLLEITTAMGFRELALNAIEHGNLGITFAQKSALLQCGKWYEEILTRLAMPEYRDRYATVDVAFRGGRGEIRIVDQGAGFDWQGFVGADRPGSDGHHGRGISMAVASDFAAVEYFGRGNEVRMTLAETVPPLA